jgi:hypothetical protein
VIDAPPRRLLIDAGPLVGAMDVRDEHHAIATRGFRELHAFGTRLLLPLPILFEVYKRVCYDVNPEVARRALDYMVDAFEVYKLHDSDLAQVYGLLAAMPWWGGSLEDATLAMLGLARDVPVWTFNYRDLKAFPNLQFWTPG